MKRVRVALALVFRDGVWLVARRKPNVHLGNCWEFPGGKVENGESIEGAAVRELAEECGLSAEPLATLRTVVARYADRIVELLPVVCEAREGTPKPLDSQECRWVTLGEIKALEMPEVNGAILEQLEAWTAAEWR